VEFDFLSRSNPLSELFIPDSNFVGAIPKTLQDQTFSDNVPAMSEIKRVSVRIAHEV